MLSDVRGGSQLLFIVFKDRSGQYITLDGDKKVQAALGRSLLAGKFRTCDFAKNQIASQPPASGPASVRQSDAMIGPPELLNDAKFKSAYYKALGSKVKESWLAKLDGPAPAVKRIKVAGTEYLLASACKAHDCGDNKHGLALLGRAGCRLRKGCSTTQSVIDRCTSTRSCYRVGAFVAF